MSTQHRPTFHPAVGSSSGATGARSYHFSVKDQTAHTRMKYRAPGQASREEMLRRDLAEELERKEMQLLQEKRASLSAVEQEEKKVDAHKVLMLTASAEKPSEEQAPHMASAAAPPTAAKKFDDSDARGSDSDGFGSSRYS
jgi:protein CWC15